MMQLWTNGTEKFLVAQGDSAPHVAARRGIVGDFAPVALPVGERYKRTACYACGTIYDASMSHCPSCAHGIHNAPVSVACAIAEAQCMLSGSSEIPLPIGEA